MTAPAREPTYAADHLPEPDCSYPVLVVETHTHVVWMAGDSPADALAKVQRYPWYELVSDETRADTYAEVRAPEPWEWDVIYGDGWGGNYLGMECDAHVDSYRHQQVMRARLAEIEACVAAGHPNVKTYPGEASPLCATCSWLHRLDDTLSMLRASLKDT